MSTPAQVRQQKLFFHKGHIASAAGLFGTMASYEEFSKEYRKRLYIIHSRINDLLKDFDNEVGWDKSKRRNHARKSFRTSR